MRETPWIKYVYVLQPDSYIIYALVSSMKARLDVSCLSTHCDDNIDLGTEEFEVLASALARPELTMTDHGGVARAVGLPFRVTNIVYTMCVANI